MDDVTKLQKIASIIDSCKTNKQLSSCFSFISKNSTFFAKEDNDNRILVKEMILHKIDTMTYPKKL